jgi:hypothetical protein
MKQLDGVTIITLILIASFAIDRIVTAILFLLSFAGLAPDAATEKKYKLMYFVLAGGFGIGVLAIWGQIRVLKLLGLTADPWLDTFLTGIVLVGGADRIASLIKLPGGGDPKPAPQPIEITGKLVLEDTAKATSQRAG